MIGQQFRYKNRRATAAQWLSKNPVLGEAEIGYEKDTRKFKFGDGATPWADLPYAYQGDYIPSSHEVDLAQAIVLDDRTLPASPNRKLVSHWGAGISFPVIGVLQGDTFVRTDVGTNGSLWTYIGGSSGKNGWVHKGPIVCTAFTRPSTTTIAYMGLQIFEMDTGKTYVYDGTAYRWIPQGDSGLVAITLNNPITAPSADLPWYRKFGNRVSVHINSNYSGSYGNGLVFFTLPIGFRPPTGLAQSVANQYFSAVSYNGPLTAVSVEPTGLVRFSGVTATFSGLLIDLSFDAA
jgi:major tropism determinant Mtd-like protein